MWIVRLWLAFRHSKIEFDTMSNRYRSCAKSPSRRIVSMDQFRGYTVAGMFLVNFVGGLAAFPEVLKHHNGHPYFSYADTIMPSFMFAAGFSYRLTVLRRLGQQGRPPRLTAISWSAASPWS